MGKPIRVLIIDDNEGDMQLMLRELESSGFEPDYLKIETEKEFRNALEKGGWDLILAEHALPLFSGAQALKLMKEMGLDIPFVVVASTITDETVANMMRTGVTDFVFKEKKVQLGPSIERVMQEKMARQKAEHALNALEESEARYRELFNNMSNAVVVYEAVDYGEDFIFRDVNRAGCLIENVNREDVIGKRVTEVFPGVVDFGIHDIFKRVWKTGHPEHFPLRFYEDNRISGWRDNFIYKLPSGEVVAVYEDVTEKRQAEENLNRSLRINTAIAELKRQLLMPTLSMDDVAGLLIKYCTSLTQSEHCFVGRIDPASRDLITCAVTEMISHGCSIKADGKLLHFPHSPDGKYINLWGHALNKPEGFYTNNPARHVSSGGIPEGHIKITNYLSAPAMFADEPVGLIGLANSSRNYTDEDLEILNRLSRLYALAILRERERQTLIEKNIELQAALKVQAEFLSIVSHELKTPLVPIIGYTDLLADGTMGPITPEAHNVIGIIKSRALDLSDLIEDILTVTSINQSRLNIKICDVAVDGIIQDVVMDFRSVALADGALINNSGDKITVRADPSRLKQVLRNLVENALKYSSHTAEISIKTEKAGDSGLIHVTDQGIGIDERHLEYIFERFYQVENTTTRTHGGTGLGLAISKELITAMGGKISVTSKSGEGSTFSVELPLGE